MIVRLGEAVALFCNVTQQPVPTIVWYKNDIIIVPDAASAPNSKYTLLDDGQYLVIYKLVDDDITATYKCGVTNVVNRQNSSYKYTLNKGMLLIPCPLYPSPLSFQSIQYLVGF